MRLIEALNYGIETLKNHSDSSHYEATVLLEESSGKSKEEILINNEVIQFEVISVYKKLLRRRVIGEPLQYVIGKTNFLGMDIMLNQDTFIPRPETELMAQYAIVDGKSIKNPTILEVGTGSGAIAISLALNLLGSSIIATDISLEALSICKKNIAKHNLERQILTFCADSTDSIKMINNFDMIISNPPYISGEELKNLPELVKKEPRIAFDGGRNGVKLINKILEATSLLLKKDGILYIELSKENLSYLNIPCNLNYKILNDQYGKRRIFRGVKR